MGVNLMSEQILERTASPSSSSMPPMADPSQDATPKRRRTFLIGAMAIVGGLVLGGLALFFMKPAAEVEPLSAIPTAPDAATTAEQAAEAEQEAGVEQVAATKARVKLTSRDPFAPLVAKPAPAAAPAPVPAAPAPDSSAPDAEASSGSASSAKGGTISALTISPLGNSVKLKLDGKKYTVDEGEQFAKSYRLYDIFNANCAGFLFGDQNAVVCEGDSVSIG
jgi:hypothetical protein